MPLSANEAAAANYQVSDILTIDEVPSWFPVGFCLLTHGQDQYVAYYNKDHQMIVAHRRIPERTWQKAELPSMVGWDSHNYITMALGIRGDIHLSGNMHCVPLIYFRTRNPGDITSFEKLVMTGKEEQRCTYPRFLHAADDTLLYMYRSGGSGNGRRFYNRYDTQTKTWTRFFDMPLFEGQGKRNAYPLGPKRGPQGLYHLVWVWRDTPDCATNHHLSYAQSSDLKNWKTAGALPLQLPFTLEQSAACVDPIPSGGGIINGCQRLLFDQQNRPIIVYHKRDEYSHMQIYVARFQDGHWHRRAITNWDKEIPFSGRGAMPFIGIKIGEVKRLDEGLITLTYRHRDYGSGRLFLDEETLNPVDKKITLLPDIPRSLTKTTIDFKGMRVKLTHDLGASPEPNKKYILRWETLGAHHDRPRKPPLPPASVLKLIVLEKLQS